MKQWIKDSLSSAKAQVQKHWRGMLARLPLPMLAIPASYGVYEFSELFFPTWVAIMQAAAFEAVYIGMAAYDKLSEKDRKRALIISLFAVFASIAYNSLASIFHLSPETLTLWRKDFVLVVVLSILHGTPLALLGFFVSFFTLHRSGDGGNATSEQAQKPLDTTHALPVPSDEPSIQIATITEDSQPAPSVQTQVESTVAIPNIPLAQIDNVDRQIVALLVSGKSQAEIGKAVGMTRQGVGLRLQKMKRVAPSWLKEQLSRKVES